LQDFIYQVRVYLSHIMTLRYSLRKSYYIFAGSLLSILLLSVSNAYLNAVLNAFQN